MKTPREILLSRHQAAEAKLDGVRESIVATLGERRPPVMQTAGAKGSEWLAILASFCRRCAAAPWQELILPSRRLWTGLAAVWVVLLVINFSQRDTGGAARSIHAPAVMVSWQVQQRWVNELLADRADRMTPPDIDRPRNVIPRPRTEHAGVAMA
jgi:hypothetical protein